MKKSKVGPASKQAPEIWRCSAVVVAAGTSSRMSGKMRKPFLKLKGLPVLTWTLRHLARVQGLDQLVLVTRVEDRTRAQQALKQAKLRSSIQVSFVNGGARRQDSVINGLNATRADHPLVLIHDAARPFPPLEAIQKAIDAAAHCGGAILAMPVKDTVKRERKLNPSAPINPELNGRHIIRETVARSGLWLAQTPQVFRRTLILEHLERLKREAPLDEVTDDAAALERYGHAVALIESSSANLKITRHEDLAIAEALLKAGLVR